MPYDNGIAFDVIGTLHGNEIVNVIDRDGNPLEYEVPRWKANWTYKRLHSPAIRALLDSWDGGDPFGSAMSAAWAVAECGRAMGNAEPGQTLNYRPSPLSYEMTIEQLADGQAEDAGFETAELASAIQQGLVTEDDLVFAAKVLSRYIDICERAGKSY